MKGQLIDGYRFRLRFVSFGGRGRFASTSGQVAPPILRATPRKVRPVRRVLDASRTTSARALACSEAPADRDCGPFGSAGATPSRSHSSGG